MARLFVSFVHEDEKLASAVQGLLSPPNHRIDARIGNTKAKIWKRKMD
jgi:hypothetical protein